VTYSSDAASCEDDGALRDNSGKEQNERQNRAIDYHFLTTVPIHFNAPCTGRICTLGIAFNLNVFIFIGTIVCTLTMLLSKKSIDQVD